MEQHLLTQTRQEQLEQPRMAAVGTVPWKCDMSIIHLWTACQAEAASVQCVTLSYGGSLFHSARRPAVGGAVEFNASLVLWKRERASDCVTIRTSPLICPGDDSNPDRGRSGGGALYTALQPIGEVSGRAYPPNP